MVSGCLLKAFKSLFCLKGVFSERKQKKNVGHCLVVHFFTKQKQKNNRTAGD